MACVAAGELRTRCATAWRCAGCRWAGRKWPGWHVPGAGARPAVRTRGPAQGRPRGAEPRESRSLIANSKKKGKERKETSRFNVSVSIQSCACMVSWTRRDRAKAIYIRCSIGAPRGTIRMDNPGYSIVVIPDSTSTTARYPDSESSCRLRWQPDSEVISHPGRRGSFSPLQPPKPGWP